MQVVIAVDPGESTGVAVFKDGRLAEAFTSTAPHSHLEDLLLGRTAVCESSPTIHSHQSDLTTHVETLVGAAAKEVVYVKPGQWKPHPWSTLTELDLKEVSNRHEKDAARIGRWFLRMRGLSGREETETPGSIPSRPVAS